MLLDRHTTIDVQQLSEKQMSAEKAAQKQRGRPFVPGRSGNPAGKPPGTRHQLTILAQQLMAKDAQAVVAAVIKAAKSGDMAAARIILDRILPSRKGAPVKFDLPPIERAADVLTALGAVLAAVAAGDLTPDEAAAVAGLLDAKRKALETVEIEARLADLEAKVKK